MRLEHIGGLMGWKRIKEHYRIGHIVHVTSKGICIGSPYIHDIITIADGKPRWGTLGRPRTNDDLCRYFDEMEADLDKLAALIDAPDEFDNSITVYTYNMGEIIEKQCEEVGWPNCTHDGELMYENMFSTDRAEIVATALRNAEAGVSLIKDTLVEAEQKVLERKSRLSEYEAAVRQLRAA